MVCVGNGHDPMSKAVTVTRDSSGWTVTWPAGAADRELHVQFRIPGAEGWITYATPPVGYLPASGLALGVFSPATAVRARIRSPGGAWSEWQS